MTNGLRERKKIETRRVIADAALNLAIERGPGNVTIDDIAAAADVSPRTVFNHFPTKDAAILDIDPRRRGRIAESIAERPSDETPFDAVRAVFTDRLTSRDDLGIVWRARAKLVSENPQLAAAHAAAQHEWEEELAAVVARRCGVDDDHRYPRIVVATVLAMTRLALERAVTARRPTAATVRLELDQAFDTIARGLTPPDDIAGGRSGGAT